MNKKLKGILKLVAGLVIMGFLISYFLKNLNSVAWGELDFKPLFLIISLIFLFSDYLFLSWLWKLLLARLGFRMDGFLAHRIFFTSLLGRYMPGKAWYLVGRVYLSDKAGAGKKRPFASVILETTMLFSSGLIAFIIPLMLIDNIPKWLILAPVIAIPILLVIMVPRVLESLLNIALRIIKKGTIEVNLRYSQVLAFLFLHVFRWVLNGLFMFFLAMSIIDIPIDLIFIMPGVMGIGTVIGIISIFSPGGLGVREGIIVLLLAPFVSVPVAIILSVVARVFQTVAEVVLALFFRVARKKLSNSQ